MSKPPASSGRRQDAAARRKPRDAAVPDVGRPRIDGDRPAGANSRPANLLRRQVVAGFEVRIVGGEPSYALQVLQAGQLRYSEEFLFQPTWGADWSAADQRKLESLRQGATARTRSQELRELERRRSVATWLEPGRDITGNRLPNLVIQHPSGGNAFCHTVEMLELGATVRKIAEVPVADRCRDHDVFQDLDLDGFPELVTWEWALREWARPGLEKSELARVVLKYSKGTFQVWWPFMEKPEPRGAELAAIRALFARPSAWDLDVRSAEPRALLLRSIIGLIYTGRATLAHRLLMELWPNPIAKERDRWLRELSTFLRKSPFWTGLAPRVSPPF